MRARILTAVAIATIALGAAPAGAAAGEQLATDASGGPIAAYGGTRAWSRYDPSVSAFRLVVWRAGIAATLPVTPSQRPFDVSAGPGPSGSVWLVWSRCKAPQYATPLRDCDVVRYDLADPGERPVPAAARSGRDEFAPSIWRNRIAFARSQGSALAPRVGVYSAPPAGGSARAVVAAMPATTCTLGLYGACAPVTNSSLTATALRRDKLLVATRVNVRSGSPIGICGDASVRLVDLRSGETRSLVHGVCGLSGLTFDSTAFDGSGRALYVRRCPGDDGSCLGARSGPFRYTPSSGRTERLVVPYGAKLRAVAVDGDTPIVEAAVQAPSQPGPCSLIAGLGPDEAPYLCGLVTTVAPAAYRSVATKPARVPPDGYRAVHGANGLALLRPPSRISCIHADPAPRARPLLWAGTYAVDARGRSRPYPAVGVTATAGGRTVRATVPSHTRQREEWIYVALRLGDAGACGRVWTLTYRPPGGARVSFRVRVSAR